MSSLIFLGDTHSLKGTVSAIENNGLDDCTVFHVGDMGLVGSKIQIGNHIHELNFFCKERGIKLYAIRGNHDNPHLFVSPPTLSNLILLPDYSLISLSGKRILAIGGGISVDRDNREMGIDYWPEERIQFRPIQNIEVDIVVSHDCPTFVGRSPHGIKDKKLFTDIAEGRKILNAVKERVKTKRWIFGHHHEYSNVTFDDTYYRGNFVGLDISQVKEFHN